MRLAVLAALLLSGCAYSPELTVLAGPKRIEGDVEAGLTLMLIQRFGERGHGACGWVHGSDIGHGVPFNDKPEYVFDSPGCGARWGGRKR